MRSRVISALAARISDLPRAHPMRVAVDGPDMAGKSTLADELGRALASRSTKVIRASADDFHHPREVRYQRGRASPEGYYYDAFDVASLKELLLDPLGPRGNRRYVTAVFDWRTDTPVQGPVRRAPDDAILVVDGVFLLRPELIADWDFSIFVWATEQERLSRSKKRDLGKDNSVTEIEGLFWARYAPAHRLYWQSVSPRERAEAFVDNERPLEPSITYRARRTR